MKCIDTKSSAYLELQEMTGLKWFELNALIRDYYERREEIPTVDKCLTIDRDTSKHLIKTYGLKKFGKHYTTSNGEMLDQIELNNIYRDLEITVRETSKTPIIDIKQRALPNRTLYSENVETNIPVFQEVTNELLPISNNKYKIYEYKDKFYASDQRISNSKLLKYLPSFNTFDEAENAIINFPKSSISGGVILEIKRQLSKLNEGFEIKVQTNYKLPESFKIFEDFQYPQFVINYNQQELYKYINETLSINPKSLDNLEETILRAWGYNDSQISEYMNVLRKPIELESILNNRGEYIIRKVQNSQSIQKSNDEIKSNSVADNLEPMLDRLEELYGISFKRITNDEIRNSNLSQYVPDATQVNAFILNGEIYINMDNAKVDAPIHELSHLLLGTLRQTNPELYMQLVNSVEQYPEYEYELKKYKNRSRVDANEEIFVDLFARAYTGQLDLGLDKTIMEDVEYEIERNLDSAIFPNKSTTTENLSNLMGKSMLEIMNIFGTVINKDNIAKAFADDLGTTSRYMANMKESLFKTGDLKEYCNG